MYFGSKPDTWKKSNYPIMHRRQPNKEATAFDYVPDGTGRDLYVINNYGLKRNYRSQWCTFEHNLRERVSTPMMDAKVLRKSSKFDSTQYFNWPSP